MSADQITTEVQDHTSIEPNDVLITNSLVIQASTAIESSVLDAGLFFDLSSLIEAVVLHDHLLFINSPLNDYYASQPLRQLLIREGILKQYTPSINAQELKDEIISTFTQRNPDFWNPHIAGIQESIVSDLDTNNILPYIFGESSDDISIQIRDAIWAADQAAEFRNLPESFFDNADMDDPQESLSIYFAGLMRQWNITAWRQPNPRPAMAFLFRTLVYLTISDRFRVSFYPDLLRVPIILQVTNDLHRSLSQEAYHKIAGGFSTNIEDLIKANAPFAVNIPPLTALVFDKSSDPKDIGPVLMDIREQFSDLRSTYRQYEYTIRNAKTLRETQRARQDLIEINSRLARVYENQDRRLIQETASYLEKAIRAGANPLDPTAYSANLILKPIEWIQEWWIKRKAIHLFDIKEKMDNIQEYGQLSQKVFGVSLEAGITVYKFYNDKMKSLYFGEE